MQMKQYACELTSFLHFCKSFQNFYEKITMIFITLIFLKVYDGPRTTSPSKVYTRHERPVLVSKSSTIILVFNTGSSKHRCCHPVGWKASYQFVSSGQWNTMPSTSQFASYITIYRDFFITSYYMDAVYFTILQANSFLDTF